MDAAVNRAFMGLSALLLSITGETVRAIPPPPPDDVRLVRVLDGTTIVVAPYGDPFKVRLACIHLRDHSKWVNSAGQSDLARGRHGADGSIISEPV